MVAGDLGTDGKFRPNANTELLGKILNSPQNLRQIPATINAAKSFLLNRVYAGNPTDAAWFDGLKSMKLSDWETLYHYMAFTKRQHDEAVIKAADFVASRIIETDPTSAAAGRLLVMKRAQDIYNRAIEALSKYLAVKKICSQERVLLEASSTLDGVSQVQHPLSTKNRLSSEQLRHKVGDAIMTKNGLELNFDELTREVMLRGST